MTSKMAEAPEDCYDIGAVSRLTGLSTANLRMWEKRYGVVAPARTETQRRLYSAEDIRRLTLLKNLVDRGHSISSIAGLDIPTLEARLAEQSRLGRSKDEAPVAGRRCRLVIVGSLLQEMMRGREHSIEGARIIKAYDTLEEARDQLSSVVADLLIVECPTLFPTTVTAVQELVKSASAMRAILVYRFAQSKTAERIDKDIEGITAIQAPIDLAELRLACRAEIALARAGSLEEPGGEAGEAPPIPERRFSDAQLAKISRIQSSIDCECPHHLANLLSSLNAFEQYSAECENRTPEDAELHAYLHVATAKARSEIEEALGRVLDAEGIALG